MLAAVRHFNRAHKLRAKPTAQRRHVNASESANGRGVSFNPTLIIGATSERPNARGKKAILATGGNIAMPTQNMQNAAPIHNGPGQLEAGTV